HALHHGATAGSRQYGARLYRRFRWPAELGHRPGIWPIRIQSALSRYAVSLYAGVPVRLFCIRAHARLLALWPELNRHSREPVAHARHRRAGAAPAFCLLHDLGCTRRYCRRIVGANKCLREPERARSRPCRDRAHYPDPRRLRTSLRRFRRRGGLHDARALSCANLSDGLAARTRIAAGCRRALRTERDIGPRRGSIAALPRQAGDAMTDLRLETRALSRRFGALAALQEVDFKLAAGARHALIGPNGAGKTTFINLLAGALPPSRGSVLLKGEDITDKKQAERVKLGIARTFQINRLFRGLSVLENVCMSVAERVGAAPSMFYPLGRRTDVIEESMHLLDLLKLATDAAHRVSELPYGRQRLVEIAIAIGLKPDVLLLDEPAAGVPSAESHIILDAIERLP